MATLTSPPVPLSTAAPSLPSPHAAALPTHSTSATPAPATPPAQRPASPAFVGPADVEGITRLWLWHVPSVPVALVSLTANLQSVFGASRNGRWWTTCDHLTQKRAASTATSTAASSTAIAAAAASGSTAAAPTQPAAALAPATKELYCLTFSSQPDRCHCISPGVIVTSSATFPSFLTSLAGYTSRSTYHIEGDSFTLGDFTLSIGTLRHNSRFTSSIVVQLTYQPCCQPLPATFHTLQSVLESVMLGEVGGKEAVTSYRPAGGWPVFVDFGLGEVWTARHTALMWLFVLQMSRGAT